MLQRTLRSQLAWQGSPCAVLVISGTDTGEKATLLHQIYSLSVIKKAKDDVVSALKKITQPNFSILMSYSVFIWDFLISWILISN